MHVCSGEFIGLIPDGNRREVQAREGAPSVRHLSQEQLLHGYRMGARAVRGVIERARELAVAVIATWGMSEKNMENRTPMERGVLFTVFDEFLADLRDNWVDRPENAAVRFAHMGRRDRLQAEAPAVLGLLDEIAAHTRGRTGMTVAVCLDYGGPEEMERAVSAWKDSGCTGRWQDHLDLPRQGVPYRPLDLRIRTGEDGGNVKHANAYLKAYEADGTAEIYHHTLLPLYTPDMFQADVEAYRNTQRRKGA